MGFLRGAAKVYLIVSQISKVVATLDKAIQECKEDHNIEMDEIARRQEKVNQILDAMNKAETVRDNLKKIMGD